MLPTPSPSPFPEPLRAHAGGLDELLIIAVPVAVFLLFRWIAYKRTGGEEDDD